MAITTKDQATQSIEQIQTGANYTANQLRPLLLNLLDSIYSPFYTGSIDPNTLKNQSSGFKAGSIGRNSSSSRYFVCSASTATAATWDQISTDRSFQIITGSDNGSFAISNGTGFVSYSGSQNNVEILLPTVANSYTGKTIKVFFGNPVQYTGSGIFFKIPGSPPTTIESGKYKPGSVIEFLCNGSTWSVLQSDLNLPEYGFESINLTTATSPYQILVTAATVFMTSTIAVTIPSFTVTLPQNPYTGKTIKLFTSVLFGTVTTFTVRDQLNNTVATISGLSTNSTIEFVYSGTNWLRIF